MTANRFVSDGNGIVGHDNAFLEFGYSIGG